MKRILSLLIAIMLVFSVTACMASDNGENTAQAGEASTESKYERIVSFAPSITQILVGMGLGDKIIAVTSYDTTEGVAENIPAFDLMAPDIEAITALEPDIILSTEITSAGGSNPFDLIQSEKTEIKYFVTAESIDEIYAQIISFGEIFSREEEAQKLVDELTAVVDSYKEKAANITEKKSVYFEISPAPYMYSTGTDSYMHEMIELVGATNALEEYKSWLAVTDEMILTANPDVIFTNVNYTEAPIEEIKQRNGWNVVNAVANNEVYYIDNLSSSLANHNIVKALDEMSKALYPEIYN